MTTLLIAADGRSSLELACAASDRFVLWRRGNQVRLLLDDRHATGVRRALAFRGLSVAAGEDRLPEPPRLRAAIGTGLAPTTLADDIELDMLEIRVVPLGEATQSLLRRPFRSFPLGARRRSRCRALLRGTDVLLEVRRSAWCGRATLSRARHDLRPLLFDRTAMAPVHRVFAADGVISRWVNG